MEHIRFEQESSDEFDSSEEFEHTLEETSPNNTRYVYKHIFPCSNILLMVDNTTQPLICCLADN